MLHAPTLLAAVAAAASPAESDVEGRVTQVAGGGFFVDAGSDAGVATGVRGTVVRDGRDLAEVEVRHASAKSCYVEVILRLADVEPASGDRVRFHGTVAAGAPAVRAEGDAQGKTEAPFVPLLAPYVPPGGEPLPPIWHGSVSLDTSFLRDRETGDDFGYHSLSLRGTVERLFSGPWSLEYDFDLATRNGSGYRDDPRYGELDPRMDLLALRRHFDDGSVLGVGRFEPLALTGIGRVDGAYYEDAVDEHVHVGGLVGLRPEPDDLGFRADQPILAGWGVWARPYDRETQVSVAAGAMSTWFRGSFDEQALLSDVDLHFTGGHWVRASTQVDVYTGNESARSGAGLTRLSVVGDARLADWLDLRGTWYQFALADTLANRDVSPDDSAYGRGHRRAAVGLVETLPRAWRLEQEVAQVAGEDTGPDWQYTLRANWGQLFGVASLAADAGVWNLVGATSKGVGGQAGVSWLASGTTLLRASYSTNRAEFDGSGPLYTRDLQLMLSTTIGGSTSLWISGGRSWGDALDTLHAEAGISWSF
jgi:hypothetical protein